MRRITKAEVSCEDNTKDRRIKAKQMRQGPLRHEELVSDEESGESEDRTALNY
jgi:hypothetical protein